MDRYQKFIAEKAARKREFMGKMFFPRKPILLLDFINAENLEYWQDLIEGLEAINLTTFILWPGSRKHAPTGKNIFYIDEESKNQALETADFALTFDHNTHAVWAKGCVPIAPMNGDSTLNYNPLQEKGNGFYFKNPTKWEVFAAIVRALETYQFPYDWENLIREILNSAKN